jgi:hypothetical protein
MKHVRENKGWSERDIQAFIARQYDLTGKKIILPSSEMALNSIPEPSGARNLEEEPDAEEDEK